ncbi:hypothetical protein Pcinc_031424 [Petrolisthes cinctipes]|uniref:Uncharacterized protein n=1 Tax=Petrolisthes cinctipes TaxID=88211 RepID=A0AAE1EWD9_PETCI|nr:hypothetical protein Pcinc_031424 [Petrolisthes cinctipes]
MELFNKRVGKHTGNGTRWRTQEQRKKEEEKTCVLLAVLEGWEKKAKDVTCQPVHPISAIDWITQAGWRLSSGPTLLCFAMLFSASVTTPPCPTLSLTPSTHPSNRFIYKTMSLQHSSPSS